MMKWTKALNHPTFPRALALGLALASTTLAGCAAIPKVERSLQPRTAAQVGLSGPSAAAIAPDWWTAMGDPQLDRLVKDALAGNPSLDETAAREKIAQSLVANFKAGLLPTVSANASTTDELFSKRYIYPAPLAGSWDWMSNAELDLGWSLDLAGRQKALIAAAKSFGTINQLEDAATRISLSGAVAQAYVNLARAEAQGRIARDFVTSREAGLRLIEARKAANLANDLDLAASRALLAQARQAVVRADGARTVMVHALAALAGRGPDYYASITPTNLHFEKALPVPQSLPVDLLARRADLLAARKQVDIAIAGEKIAWALARPLPDRR